MFEEEEGFESSGKAMDTEEPPFDNEDESTGVAEDEDGDF